jgi:hypothetical protein
VNRHRVGERGLLRPLFTRRFNLYRLLLGAAILGIVLPVQASGYQPVWPVVVGALVGVVSCGILLSRLTPLGTWLRRQAL